MADDAQQEHLWLVQGHLDIVSGGAGGKSVDVQASTFIHDVYVLKFALRYQNLFMDIILPPDELLMDLLLRSCDLQCESASGC